MGKDNIPSREDVGYIYGPNGNRLEKLDKINKSYPSISNKEVNINAGLTYILNKNWDSVADATTQNLALMAPSDKYLHVFSIVPLTTGSIGELQAERGASISAGTSINSIPNLNGDNNAPESGVTATYDVTIDTSGNNVFEPDSKLFGSQTDKKAGPLGIMSIEINLIVQPGDAVIIKITNSAGSSVDYLGVNVLWDELDKGFETRQ